MAADLEVVEVVKRYGGAGSARAVDGLSLAVAHGSFFSILGPSGCGKTTLLRMIAGFIEPDAGEIRIGGRSMAGVAPNRRPVTMVFQHLALFPMMSVGDNVGYGLARRGLPKGEIRAKAGAMLERVGLSGAYDKRPDQLSGGQKQRVAIARSLVLEPTLLLLDEPLGALDLKLREHMKIELKQLQAAFGTTFVYITHDQSEALVLSDRVAVMNAGRFEQVGAPQDLYYHPTTAFVAGFVGANNRLAASVTRVEPGPAGARVEARSAEGLRLWARLAGPAGSTVAVGDTLACFLRPEAMQLGRTPLPADDRGEGGVVQWQGQVSSLLFDGANSAVLVRESASGAELRIALPQTGAYADLAVGETVHFACAADQALAYKAAA